MIIYTIEKFLTEYKIVNSCQLLSMENLSFINQVHLKLLCTLSFCNLVTG